MVIIQQPDSGKPGEHQSPDSAGRFTSSRSAATAYATCVAEARSSLMSS
jgi:hypothetical protein